ncbi:MAG: VOC family protein [Chloroflexi bacterium AL-W]|nr:VOC family protein [Chloroflexi bacterium AL-N1]NOK69538.1 VOC family protein [Chloroflexi bacterium AL-N10]NOK77503.1 VOC family protein [Chloroflexi bacterium AL-N5]NOK84354.1 VOC family protein [Chloroflexi bacterium AL-W]NOK91480.1 VOC family protein [Chloroflexi bacterium AL-N15]
MKLNHLNLTVTHVLEAHQFLETYFGLQNMGVGTDKMAGLLDDNGLTLVLMKGGEESNIIYPKSFHIGFTQESKEQVDDIYQRLRDDGFDIPAPRDLHGGWAFYFQAPGGFMIEVSC